MNQKGKFLLPVFILLLIATALGTYIFFLRNLISLAYHHNAPLWFENMVDHLYPRFQVEKNRLPLTFFIDKADQIFFRMTFISLSIIVFYFSYYKIKRVHDGIKNFWDSKISLLNIRLIRILYFLFLFLILKDIYIDFSSLSQAKAFFNPIWILNILSIEFPSQNFILIIYVILIISCLCGMANVFPVTSSIAAILIFLYIQGIIFSFEKTDHGFATYTYAGLIMPFLLFEAGKAKENNLHLANGWPLKLIMLVISLCYFFSGLEKLFISKMEWVNPETFKGYLEMHQAPLGLKVLKNDFLCRLLPVFTLIFQIGFISVLLKPSLKWLFLPSGIIFHLSSYFLFNVGGFANPWIFAYLFFIDWDLLMKKLTRKKS